MTQQTFACPRCAQPVAYGQLVCGNCGALVYASRLNEIAAAAQALEPRDPQAAAHLWMQALQLLPDNSQQAHMLRQRVAMLATPSGALPQIPYEPAAPPKHDRLPIALLKTGGSMLLSIAIYSTQWGWQFATGFVVLILVHELGHSLAMIRYRLKASPPIFIPFVGALINLREPPRNAWEEAAVGIAGPLSGTVGAIVCYFYFLKTGSPLALELAGYALFLNFFNLLPVPPLDGGRVTAAISPFIWMPGLLVAVGWGVHTFIKRGHINYMLVLLLFFAWPRVKQTLLGKAGRGEYYQIGAAKRWTMGICYAGLGLILLMLLFDVMRRDPTMFPFF